MNNEQRRTPQTRIPRSPPNSPDDVYRAYWVARVRSRVKISESGCWIWQGNLSSRGYGQTQYRGKTKSVHRQLYKVLHDVSLSTKQYVCHRCDERKCCNPDHLFLGTQSDNMADSVRKGRHAEQSVTHCPRKHPYNEANTYVTPSGARNCKVCMRARMRIAGGWPIDLAYSMPAVPHGQRPVNARNYRKRKAA